MYAYGINLLKPCSMHDHDPPASFPNPYCQPSGNQPQQLMPARESSFWKLLYPSFFGTAGALMLSVFAGDGHPLLHRGAKVFKLSLVFYAIGTSVAASYAITKVLTDSKPPHTHLLYPIATVLVSLIVFFSTVYFLLYRFFPDSYKGDVGNNLGIQFLSFIYFSVTTMATGDLGDILPNSPTVRVLVSTEIMFFLFTITTAIQLILVRYPYLEKE